MKIQICMLLCSVVAVTLARWLPSGEIFDIDDKHEQEGAWSGADKIEKKWEHLEWGKKEEDNAHEQETAAGNSARGELRRGVSDDGLSVALPTKGGKVIVAPVQDKESEEEEKPITGKFRRGYGDAANDKPGIVIEEDGKESEEEEKPITGEFRRGYGDAANNKPGIVIEEDESEEEEELVRGKFRRSVGRGDWVADAASDKPGIVIEEDESEEEEELVRGKFRRSVGRGDWVADAANDKPGIVVEEDGRVQGDKESDED